MYTDILTALRNKKRHLSEQVAELKLEKAALDKKMGYLHEQIRQLSAEATIYRQAIKAVQTLQKQEAATNESETAN